MLRSVVLVKNDVSEALSSSETLVITRATRRNIPYDTVLQNTASSLRNSAVCFTQGCLKLNMKRYKMWIFLKISFISTIAANIWVPRMSTNVVILIGFETGSLSGGNWYDLRNCKTNAHSQYLMQNQVLCSHMNRSNFWRICYSKLSLMLRHLNSAKLIYYVIWRTGSSILMLFYISGLSKVNV
jgi:hypothetical protein